MKTQAKACGYGLVVIRVCGYVILVIGSWFLRSYKVYKEQLNIYKKVKIKI